MMVVTSPNTTQWFPGLLNSHPLILEVYPHQKFSMGHIWAKYGKNMEKYMGFMWPILNPEFQNIWVIYGLNMD